jgi:hypothetical protein
MKRQRAACAILASWFVVIAILTVACSQERAENAPSILNAKGDSLPVVLLDAATAGPIVNAEVELWSDNGVRCVQAPCPTNGRQWRGRSNAAGQVVIPKKALQPVTSIKASGYDGDLIEDSEFRGDGGWTAELFPRDTSDSPPRPIKLIDGRSGKPIANAPVRVEFTTKDARQDSVTRATNALGYVFVPDRVVLEAAERSWVVVPGYRRTQLDFAWTRRRTRLERR